jgi:hypothetical protein
MGVEDRASRTVIHLGFEVLNQRAAAPDVECLRAVADGEDGLVEVKGVLQEELIHRRTGDVGFAALGDWNFAISLRVNVIAAAGEKDSLNPEEQPGDPILALMERYEDGCDPDGVEGSEISRQGTLIVAWVTAGRFGNGDVNGH